MYNNGLENKTALVFNITAVLKYVSSTFMLERLLYNTALIKTPWIILKFIYNWSFQKLFPT